MSKLNWTHIRLIRRDGKESVIPAPDEFTWKPYPTQIRTEGKNWEYKGAIDGYPCYLELQ